MSSRSAADRRAARFPLAFAAAVLAGSLLAAGCMPSSLPPAPAPAPQDRQLQVDAWVRSLTGLSPAEQGSRAADVWRDPTVPLLVRERATHILATRPNPQSQAARQALARAYALALPEARAAMERMLMADLLTSDHATLRFLGAGVLPSQEENFPWSLILWTAADRNLLSDSRGVKQRLSRPGIFADASLLGLASLLPEPARSGRLALLLPLSGPYGDFGNKAASGADVAKQILAGQGIHMDVRIIDTEQPSWTEQMASLPPDCVTVGGPLRGESYTLLRERGLLNGRALFAFLSQLPFPEDEGRAAWRFFTSQQDQIDAVLDFAQEQGVHSLGVLAPDDAFGQRMAALFQQMAAQRGLPVSGGSYPSQNMEAWTKALGDFVGAVHAERGEIPRAGASFEAIFLPDSWKNMDMLISTLHYHGAFQKIMLGPVLWEQSLTTARGLNASTFALTVFPGVWDMQSDSGAARQLEAGMFDRQMDADAWSVLGHDFVLFAAALSLNAAPPASVITSRLASGITLEWAGAPMTWDREGKAHRRLFLFQPSRFGMVPLDRQAFALYRNGAGPLPNRGLADDPVPPGPAAVPEDLEPELQNLIETITGNQPRNPAPLPPPAATF